jgi:hypothetical protein
VAVRALAEDGQPGAPTRKLLLESAPVEIGEADQGLVVVNAGGWGVFRVGYEAEHRLALAAHLPDLTPLERSNLLTDTWATTLAGHSTLEDFLILAAKLGLEPDPTPWAPVGTALLLTNRFAADDDRPVLHEAVAAIVGRQHAHLGFDAVAGEGDRTPTLRSLCILLMGGVGADEGVRSEAARRFDDSPVGGGTEAPIPADIESATLNVVAQLLRAGDYDALLARYRSASTPQEELRSLGTLTTFPDVDLARRTFDLALTEVRSQNGFIVIGGLLANPVAGQAIWQRMTESWDLMLERFPKNAHTRMVESIPTLCADADFAEGVVRFLNDHPLASGPRRVAQSIERLNVNVAFVARERASLAHTLQAAIAASQAS